MILPHFRKEGPQKENMPHFVSTEPVQIRLNDGDKEWIAIKPKLSAGERGLIYDAMLDVDMQKQTGDGVDMKMRYGAYLVKLAQVAICAWYLEDDKGNPIEFNRAHIADFDPDDPLYDKVLGEIATRNPFGKKAAGNTT
jgi:hypothetical protein